MVIYISLHVGKITEVVLYKKNRCVVLLKLKRIFSKVYQEWLQFSELTIFKLLNNSYISF